MNNGFERARQLFDKQGLFAKISEAKKVSEEQRRIWLYTIEKLVKAISGIDQDINVSYLGSLTEKINNDVDFFEVEETEEGYKVSGKIPLIVKSGNTLEWYIAFNSVEFYGIVYAETMTSNPGANVNSSISSIASAYLSFCHFQMLEKDRAINFEKKTNEVIGTGNGYIESFSDKSKRIIDIFEHNANSIQDQFNKSQEERENNFNAFSERAKAEIDASKKLAFENQTLTTARSIWSRKTKKHRLYYWLSFLMIFAFIVVGIWEIFVNIDKIKAFILTFQKEDKEIPYGIIVLALIPILSIA